MVIGRVENTEKASLDKHIKPVGITPVQFQINFFFALNNDIYTLHFPID